MTWEEIIQIDARVKKLHEKAKNLDINEDYCADREWFRDGGFRDQLKELVGFKRQDKPVRLRTAKAYEIAYQKIYHALPDCRCCR